MNQNQQKGRVITFYSYKGGSGRSMLLANIAWSLADNGKRVLVIDWDLEAPGLHYYFAPFIHDRLLINTMGLIDMACHCRNRIARKAMSQKKAPDIEEVLTELDLDDYRIGVAWNFPKDGALHIMPAGQQDQGYAVKSNTFNWEDFFNRMNGCLFFEGLKKKWFKEENYDYILIDSRTGVGDTAGICTVHLPDDLVICCAPNNQSIDGAVKVAQKISNHRPDLRIFPVFTRTENGEHDKLSERRELMRKGFDSFLYHLNSNEIETYWLETGNIRRSGL